MKLVPIVEVAPLVADRVTPFVGTRAFISTSGLDDEGHLTPEEVTYEGRPTRADLVVQPNDVCFARMQGTTKVCEFSGSNRDLILSTGFAVLRPNPDRLHAGFLRHWLRTEWFQSAKDKNCSGATQRAITNEWIETLLIPLPPLAEQVRVVAILDRTEKLLTTRREALEQCDELVRSKFVDLFGDPASNPKNWPIQQLASLVREGDSINYGVIQPGEDVQAGVPLVRVGDLVGGRVDKSAIKRIAPEIEAAYRRSRLQGDEILVSCVGSIGIVALADESVRGFNIARAVARIPLADPESRAWMTEYLKTDFVQNYFVSELRTVSQPTLNIKQISETPVSIPTAPLRVAFSRYVAGVERLRNLYQSSLEQFNTLLDSIRQTSFRGGA